MSFRLKPGKPIRRGLKRIVRDQLRRARLYLDEGAERQVHQARKSVKKVRAVGILLERADTRGIRKDQRRLRNAAHILSELRDAEAVIATLDRVRRAFPRRFPEHTFALMHRDLARVKTSRIADASRDGSLARAADTLRTVRRSAATWDIPSIDPLELPTLVKTAYREAGKAMRHAQESSRAKDFHRWRKRVKTLWYQLRLLDGLTPALRGAIRRLDTLETMLGEYHDLSVLEAAIAADASPTRAAGDRFIELTTVTAAMQNTLRRKVLRLGRRLLADRPKVFARRVHDALSASGSHAAPAGASATAAA